MIVSCFIIWIFNQRHLKLFFQIRKTFFFRTRSRRKFPQSPASRSCRVCRSIRTSPCTFKSAFGVSYESGANRVDIPAAMITALSTLYFLSFSHLPFSPLQAGKILSHSDTASENILRIPRPSYAYIHTSCSTTIRRPQYNSKSSYGLSPGTPPKITIDQPVESVPGHTSHRSRTSLRLHGYPASPHIPSRSDMFSLPQTKNYHDLRQCVSTRSYRLPVNIRFQFIDLLFDFLIIFEYGFLTVPKRFIILHLLEQIK